MNARSVGPIALARVTAAAWLVVAAVLWRMATNGSFVVMAVQWEPRSRALLSGALGVAILASLALGGLMITRPDRRLSGISMAAGALTVLLAIPLLAMGHDSATLLAPLGLLIAALSIATRRSFMPRPSGR